VKRGITDCPSLQADPEKERHASNMLQQIFTVQDKPGIYERGDGAYNGKIATVCDTMALSDQLTDMSLPTINGHAGSAILFLPCT
jgi:hypothetical protein